MAVYKQDIVDVDLNSGTIYRSFLNHSIGMTDNSADRFGVRVFRNGQAEDLTGVAVQGYFRDPNGNNIAITSGNQVSGNVAVVVLPQACYNYEGQFCLAIKLVGGGVTGTVRIVDGVVDNTNTGGAVAPTETVPTYQEILALYDEMADATTEAESVKETMAPFNAIGFPLTASLFPNESHGFTVTKLDDFTIHIEGRQTERGTFNLINESTVPDEFVGKKICLFIDYINRTTDYKIPFDVYIKTVSNPTSHALINDAKGITFADMPDDVTDLIVRIDIPADASVTLDEDIMVTVLNGKLPNPTIPENQLITVEVSALTDETDLNNLRGNHDWLMISGVSYLHKPDDMTSNAGFISVRDYGGYLLHTIWSFSGGMMWKRRSNSNATEWEDWNRISGSGGGTVIENTYNITTSPTITTDANGWLQAVDTDTQDETGKTDMTGAIMSMLEDTGYCHLGEGIFYVSGNIDMPEGSTLCGCGDKSQIRLLQSTTTGYCVKMQKYNTVKDVAFSGAYSNITPTSEGTRTAIRFSANYDGETDGSTQSQTEHCMIDSVWIRNFSGSGILCHNTSINYARGIYVTNAYIYNCWAGINIDYYSEFNKFTNICTAWCYYGCINNGGNNVFTACTFHARNTGFYIDGTKPNSAHGTINGCTFCHIGSNAGTAIKIENASNGFVIANCQVWYNAIVVNNSGGIVFDGCEFGRGITGAGATIRITDGNTVIFNGCVFMNDVTYAPDITITSNTKVKFNNCYGSVSGNAITN